MKREGIDIEIVSSFRLASTSTHFQLTETLGVREGQVLIADHSWTSEIKRDLM